MPFVGLVPIALFVEARAPTPEGRRAAVRGCALFGAVHFGILLYWIVVALVWFSPLAILAWAATVAVLAALSGAFGWLLHRALHEARTPLWLALPVLWTASEWARAHLPGSLAFPWLGLGTSLTGFPEVAGMAELVGARGLGFWIAGVGGMLASVLAGIRRGRPVGVRVAVLALVLAAPPAWGVWRARTLTMRPVARVAVVQPNIPEHLKLDTPAALDSTFAAVDRLLARLGPGDVDLVVLPEVAFPGVYIETPGAAAPAERIRAYARQVGAPLLLGGLGYEVDPSGRPVAFNSAFLMEPDGLADYRYDKRHLVPMVERVPLLLPDWLGDLRDFGSFGVGRGWPLARVGGAEYGVLVCYESSYPEAARRFRLRGADVLVNVTNDAWYGREPWYARTAALWQHPAHLVMRAIENRVGVARAANTGISMFVDPLGRIHHATELFTADVRAGTVMTTDELTFFARHGDLVGNAAAVAALALLLATGLPGRRPRGRGG